MTKAPVEAVDRVYHPGFKYSKAKVLLLNLCQKKANTPMTYFDLSARGH